MRRDGWMSEDGKVQILWINKNIPSKSQTQYNTSEASLALSSEWVAAAAGEFSRLWLGEFIFILPCRYYTGTFDLSWFCNVGKQDVWNYFE